MANKLICFGVIDGCYIDFSFYRLFHFRALFLLWLLFVLGGLLLFSLVGGTSRFFLLLDLLVFYFLLTKRVS